jgi:hypothetical protein
MTTFTLQSKIDSTDEWCFWTDITFFQTLESAKQHLDEVIRDLIIHSESENDLIDPDNYRIVEIKQAVIQ